VGKDITLATLRRLFDVVLLAAGQQVPNLIDISGHNFRGVEYGLPWLEKLNLQRDQPSHYLALDSVAGKHVVVLGAGFTAMDCSRSAMRLGASQVQVLYRRTQLEAPVDESDVEEANLERIYFQWLVSPVEILSNDGRHVSGIKMVRNKLSTPDAKGRRQPILIMGSEFVIPCDMVIVATGQQSDQSWIPADLNLHSYADGRPMVDHITSMTNVKALFATGDFTTGARNVISAIADGHKVANNIHYYLSGEQPKPAYSEIEVTDDWQRSLDYLETQRQEMPKVRPDLRVGLNRVKNLNTEVELGYSPQMAIHEATRCLQCAYNISIEAEQCILCGACVDVCPEKVIQIVPLKNLIKTGQVAATQYAETSSELANAQTLTLDEDKCVRCGLCVVRCPTAAITMTRFCHTDTQDHWYVSLKDLTAPTPI
jgi:NADPH-dependent glutamate synthase beta subunit-like oxidoreductase